MKKQILAVVLGSLFVSGGAFATPLPDGGVITTANCATIGQDVTINTSAGVVAAYSCNNVGNAAALATCHGAGSRQTRIYTCTSLDAGDDGISGNADDVWNVDPCPAGDGQTQAGEVTIPADFTGFVASTTGGGVGGTPLAGVCDDQAANVDALLPF